MHRGGKVAVRSFLQHITRVDHHEPRRTGHGQPAPIPGLYLKPRRTGGGQNGQQIDVRVSGGPLPFSRGFASGG